MRKATGECEAVTINFDKLSIIAISRSLYVGQPQRRSCQKFLFNNYYIRSVESHV